MRAVLCCVVSNELIIILCVVRLEALASLTKGVRPYNLNCVASDRTVWDRLRGVDSSLGARARGSR